MTRFFFLFAVLGMFWTSTASADAVRELTWDHLVPAGSPIDDPMRDMRPDQRIELELLASIRARRKLGLITDVDPQAEFGYEIEHRLRQEGHNVDDLMERFIKMQAEVMKRNAQMVPELDGKLVKIPGYALPLEFDGTSVEEFLLVPYVGACIHVPTPPKNQMVFVKLKQSYVAKQLYEPIWITGRLRVEGTKKKLTFFDGSTDVQAGYVLDAVRVEPYEE